MTEWKPTDISKHPRAATVRTVDFNERSLEIVAETLGGELGLADFRLPASQVWQLTVPGDREKPAAMLTLWPGIRRVDAVNGMATAVFSGVQTVEIVPGVEVQFRRSSKEVLIVARGGKLIIRA